MEIRPAASSPCARPAASAVAARGAASSAARLVARPSLARPPGVACSSEPSDENSATGASQPASSRCACSFSGRRDPVFSVATTRMAGVRSASEIREHVHISAPPRRPPKPRSRSSRGAEPCCSVPARRAICSAAEPLGSMVCPVSAVDDAALKIAAAAGLPQRIRVASALHSQTGMSPVA